MVRLVAQLGCIGRKGCTEILFSIRVDHIVNTPRDSLLQNISKLATEPFSFLKKLRISNNKTKSKMKYKGYQHVNNQQSKLNNDILGTLRHVTVVARVTLQR